MICYADLTFLSLYVINVVIFQNTDLKFVFHLCTCLAFSWFAL